MSRTVSLDNERRLHACFSEESRHEARDLLEEAAYDDRVTRAIIYLSEGDLARLTHFVEQARLDRRDVLYWAEYDENDQPRAI